MKVSLYEVESGDGRPHFVSIVQPVLCSASHTAALVMMDEQDVKNRPDGMLVLVVSADL